MKTRFAGTLVALGIGAVLIALVPAHAGSPWHGKGKGPEQMGKLFEEHIQMLNLTPEQTEQIKKQHDENRNSMRELRRALKAKNRELREELDKQDTDKKKLESTVSELKSLEAQRIDQKVKGILHMKETLTPEQFQELHSLRAEHMKNRRGLRGKKGRRRWKTGPKEDEGCLPAGKEETGAVSDKGATE